MIYLTAKQNRTLCFIESHLNIHGYPPTVREIAREMEISVRAAHDRLLALEKKGMIKRVFGHPRAIKVTRKGDAIR